MTWFSIEVQADADRRDAVAAWLVGRTGQSVEERADGTLVSFALDLAAADALERDLAVALGSGMPIAHRELPDVDWTTAWREGISSRGCSCRRRSSSSRRRICSMIQGSSTTRTSSYCVQYRSLLVKFGISRRKREGGRPSPLRK